MYSNNHAVLFIDEIHTVVGAGAQEGSMDARYGDPPVATLGYMPLPKTQHTLSTLTSSDTHPLNPHPLFSTQPFNPYPITAIC